ncbi:putative ABC transport system ATP-binding protein [Enhydrobacter aerosaccus]|uniref:Putative ABC transport system ATP-binding protein n=1 Tax=Enhydrobacter aerosaccus TaxID=225324 RepID=A0A1T4QND6_9HYPH|nr:ABC transporter ATP-binding protein [Enhydrobacter aerosaccus]SKA05280.1 putative ABC transport system ATP-binding protein [Enhydrobacter aerosaccus]
MQRNLFSYIWRHSRPEQLVILGLVVLAQVFYFLSLSVPKSIVNNGITGIAFKAAADVRILRIDIPLPDFLGGTIRLLNGFRVDQLQYLVVMSFVFLVAVIINSEFKKTINTQKGRMGERMLRRMRFELYDRILRFPPAHFRKVKQAELATMIKDEVEPLGGFIGDAFVQPMFLGGQALTAIAFIMMQNLLLSLVVIALLGVQMVIVPRLRKPVLVLGRQRQISARLLAGRIAETADGVSEIHVHGASNYERADISERLGHIFKIRFDLYNKKFVAKFWNNILSQATPFAIYLLGGYFAITGKMDVGAVVGVLLAYKDLPSPIKELIDWDQQRQDVQIKYEQVIDQFQPEGMMPPELQALPDGPPPSLGHEFVLSSVTVSDDGRVKQLDSVNLTLATDTRLAVIGAASSGKDVLGQVLGRLTLPSSGSIRIDGQDFFQIPEYVLGSRAGYIGQETYLFPLSVRDNLLFGLKHRPVKPATYDEETRAVREAFWRETARAGNPVLDPNADWIDYELAGATGPADLLPRVVDVLKQVEFDEEIYSLGLRGAIDGMRRPDLAEKILAARKALHGRLQDPGYAGLIEPFNADKYNKNLSVAENLLFGTPVGREFDGDNLAANAYMLSVLKDTGLDQDLLRMGLSIAETMVELFSGLSPDNPLFEQYSFISADELPNVRLLLQRLGGKGVEAVPEADRPRLMTLPLRYIEARHRLGLIDAAMEERLLAARREFAAHLPDSLRGAVEFYDFARYNSAATVQDNVLFGRLVYGQAQAEARIVTLITTVLTELSLRDSVIEVGLEYNVGVAGKRLPATQRQKLGIARALIKRPQFLVVNEAVAVFDGRTQDRIRDNILAATKDGRGVVWIANRPSQAEKFDRVLVMQGGRIVAHGAPEELKSKGGLYCELVQQA